MSKYSELLRDPRWQKMRLEVLQRDNWQCQNCGDKEKTLHVHHCYYERGKKPWEYPSRSLVTLCMDCHEEETYLFSNLPIAQESQPIIMDLRKCGFTQADLEGLSYAFYCYEHKSDNKHTRKGLLNTLNKVFWGELCSE